MTQPETLCHRNFSLLVVVPCEAFGQDHSRHSGTRDLEASVTRVILHLLTREVASVAKLVRETQGNHIPGQNQITHCTTGPVIK